MARSKDTRLRGYLKRGALSSFLIHAALFVPLVVAVFVYAAREERERAETVDVSFDSVPPETLPPLPPEPPDTTPVPSAPPQKKKHRDEAKKKAEPEKPPVKEAKKEPEKKPPEKKPAPKPAEKKLATLEPEVPLPPMPPMPPPPPPPKAHEKMVDLDNDKNVPPPPDAKYLAQKNNRAEVETRATDTNLEHDQKTGEQQASSKIDPNAKPTPDTGDEKPRIAELQEQKGAFGHEVPQAPSEAKRSDREEAPDEDQEQLKRSVLALREATRQEHALTPETASPSLPHDPAGLQAARAAHGAQDRGGARLPKGQRMKLTLSGRDYEYLFGADTAADRRLAQKQRSSRAGKQAAKLALIRSSLENFIPEVRPGNQTALNTRAAPFAAFVARMHVAIHKLWGFGILEDWDEMGGRSPFNDYNLMTNLEVVLNPDGSVDKVTVVQSSRYQPYDVAAIDTVYSAGPYPEPPREIRSGNGKIYLHWRFYRDGRQCATSGVDYFILENGPKNGDKASADSRPSVLSSPGPSGASRTLQRLARNADTDPRHAAKLQALNEEVARAEGNESAEAEPATAPAAEPPRETDAAARKMAESWWSSFVSGDVSAMVANAIVPFSTGQGTTNSPSDLSGMFRNLVEETSSRRARGLDVVTGAGLRRLLGKLPAGLDDGSGRLFALVRTAEDAFILVLAPVPGHTDAWKIGGLVRR